MRDLSKARASFDRDLVVLDPGVLTIDIYCLQNEKENHDAVNGYANVRWTRSYHSRSVIWHRPSGQQWNAPQTPNVGYWQHKGYRILSEIEQGSLRHAYGHFYTQPRWPGYVLPTANPLPTAREVLGLNRKREVAGRVHECGVLARFRFNDLKEAISALGIVSGRITAHSETTPFRYDSSFPN